MNKKFIAVAVIYIIIIAVSAGILIKHNNDRQSEASAENDNLKVQVNEIQQCISSGDTDRAESMCEDLKVKLSDRFSDSDYRVVLIPMIISIIGVITMLIYLDRTVLRPFRKLEKYAGDIAKGNMDTSLKVERGNYFGDFTWAFDNMRREIVKSRTAEKNAIENNKTVIATLSHDIKTPVASVRAYAEAFEANMDSTPEKRQKYLTVLMEKCDEVTKLTNDLFLHSISEMNKLDVSMERIDLVSFIKEDVRKLFVSEDEVDIKLPEEKEVYVEADPKRLLQIFENLKNNAEKYAKTRLEITLDLGEKTAVSGDDETGNEQREVRVHVRDFGPGIREEEIPFITNKFYRGKDVGDENGSGLGLYIVKELMTKMGGDVSIYNKNPGLEVVLLLFKK